MKTKCKTMGKPEPGCINEDAALACGNRIAVSDGAGGGGLFAERWSRYLLDHLPIGPIRSAEAMDGWIDTIWEPFYNKYEKVAKEMGGMPLEKFYDEGSFATLVAVWQTAADRCEWISFGDSVAFHYNKATRQLEHSFGHLGDFDEPPYLINCKDELKKEGFRSGTFHTDQHSVVFVATDALAHYIMMLYEVAQKERYSKEIDLALAHHSKNENYIRSAMMLKKINFEKWVINDLVKQPRNLKKGLIRRLRRSNLLAHDDYSLAAMWNLQ